MIPAFAYPRFGAMSRVVRLARPSARRLVATAAGAVLLLVVTIVPSAGQDLPACGDGPVSECRLPEWPDTAATAAASLFGDIAGITWVEDEAGDAPPSGLDILAAGVGRVDIADPGAVRESPELLKAGKRKKAVRPDEGVLVRIVLERPASDIENGHAGVHVATDIDGSRSNNAPAAVGSADNPFAGSEDIYSLTYATTSGETRLLDSDLSAGWYEDDDPFAASWAEPNVLDVLVRPEGMGDGFRIVTFVSAEDGGYDTLTIGPAAIPVDGQVGLLPICVEGSISTETFVVRRLVENGQTLRDVKAPASWRGGATFVLAEAEREALESLIASQDEDGDGRIGLPSTVSLFEDGVVIRQRPEVELALEGDRAQLALELGLTRRGYNVLREIEVKPTDDPVVDAWLRRASSALSRNLPPFRSGKNAGLVFGTGIGTCVPSLIAGPVGVDDGEGSVPLDASATPQTSDGPAAPAPGDAKASDAPAPGDATASPPLSDASPSPSPAPGDAAASA